MVFLRTLCLTAKTLVHVCRLYSHIQTFCSKKFSSVHTLKVLDFIHNSIAQMVPVVRAHKGIVPVLS